MAKRKRSNYVTVYERSSHYAGAEEGGWYHTISEAMETVKAGTRKQAEATRERLINEYDDDDYWVTIEKKREIGQEDNTDEGVPIYE